MLAALLCFFETARADPHDREVAARYARWFYSSLVTHINILLVLPVVSVIAYFASPMVGVSTMFCAALVSFSLIAEFLLMGSALQRRAVRSEKISAPVNVFLTGFEHSRPDLRWFDAAFFHYILTTFRYFFWSRHTRVESERNTRSRSRDDHSYSDDEEGQREGGGGKALSSRRLLR